MITSNDAVKEVLETAEASTTGAENSNDDNNEAATNSNGSSTYYDVIIIGGGPTGLSTALMLSYGFNKKCLIVEVDDTLQSSYDVSKSYMYNINGRGQNLTKQYPILQHKLETKGVISKQFHIIPGDINKPLPQDIYDDDEQEKENDKKISSSTSNEKWYSKLMSSIIPSMKTVVSSSKNRSPNAKGAAISYWIQRHELATIIKETIDETIPSDNVDFLMGYEFINAGSKSTADNKESQIAVQIRRKRSSDDEITMTFYCNLLVGADGYKSKVRQCLAGELSNDISNNSNTNFVSFSKSEAWPNIPKDKFHIKKWKSPSTGLRLKTLQFPLPLDIPTLSSEGKVLKTKFSNAYKVSSICDGPTTRIGLGFLPYSACEKDVNIRPATTLSRSTHDIWKISNGKQMKQWFIKAFPRMFNGDNAINLSNEEWERYTNSNYVTFPYCQYTNGVSYVSKDNMSGIVLLGDSLHSFPPDIGQGVNSGLADVLALKNVLQNVKEFGNNEKKEKEKEETMISLGEALKRFEDERLPETKALIRLARFGSPYQYRQPHYIDRLGRSLWLINIVTRTLLSKVTFGILAPPAIMTAFINPNKSFKQIMFHADATTIALSSAILYSTTTFIQRKYLLKK